MSVSVTFSFARLTTAPKGVVIVLTDETLGFGPTAQKLLKPADAALTRAFDAERFKGKAFSCLDMLAPAGLSHFARLIVVSLGKADDLKPTDFLKLGGVIAGRLPASAREVSVVAELPGGPLAAESVAEIALGMKLRTYSFDRYKTKKKDENERESLDVHVLAGDELSAAAAWAGREAVAEGIILARDLVNEPPNVLDPPEFARRAVERLTAVGVEVEVLDEAEQARLGMRALLGVGQGSIKESRVVVMRWNGGAPDAAPLAFIGKGVTFDSGGISIKPAAGMEDMKGDMGGAACVTGTLYALAARKAKVNVVGVIGLVENMPDGAAQRPGDIVTSMSGQTIEIVNTDAEGRLVLADVLWYAKDTFKPKLMVDFATLTGAIIVALGQEYAGLFSNDDALAEALTKAGASSGEKVWRMPLAPEYDKLIDSKFADMKNSGGRYGGSITAAQFLQRYVEKTPWAHVDIAGTAMASPASDINRSWGSGWGVRLLDRLVAEGHEDQAK